MSLQPHVTNVLVRDFVRRHNSQCVATPSTLCTTKTHFTDGGNYRANEEALWGTCILPHASSWWRTASIRGGAQILPS